jgi:hypothetical protein
MTGRRITGSEKERERERKWQEDRELPNEELHNFYSLRNIYKSYQIEEDEKSMQHA